MRAPMVVRPYPLHGDRGSESAGWRRGQDHGLITVCPSATLGERHSRGKASPVTRIPAHNLNDGTTLPAIGLGTWPMNDTQAEQAVRDALEAGYRLVDTAANYRNETGVGRGIASSGVPREEIVVTTKLPGRRHGYAETLASFEESR